MSTVLPPQQADMEELALRLDQFDAPPDLVGPDGEAVALPQEVFQVLRDTVRAMAKSQAVTVSVLPQRLTTQEAAEFLGISRPTFIKLLDAKEIPFTQPGRHRRVLLTDLLEYTDRRAFDRHAALDEMVRISEDSRVYEATDGPMPRRRR